MPANAEFPFARMRGSGATSLILPATIQASRLFTTPPEGGYLYVPYHTLLSTVEQLAARLAAHGVGSGSITAVRATDAATTLLLALAVRLLNGVPALLPPERDQQTTVARLRTIHAGFLAEETPHAEHGVAISRQQGGNHSPVRNGALIIFTSGTAGKPKAIVHTDASLTAAYTSGTKRLRYSGKNRWLLCLPPHHIGGYSVALRAFSSKGTIVIPEGRSSDAIEAALLRFGITHVSVVTPQLLGLTNAQNTAYPSLRVVLLGGGPASATLTTEALKLGLPVYKVYGSSETAAFITLLTPSEAMMHPEASGRALPGVRLRLQQEELLVSAPQLMAGYFNHEGVFTRQRKNAWFRTGDVATLHRGRLTILNRRSDLIVSGGENIDPLAVEAQVLLLPGITDCCVFGTEHTKWGMQVNVVVVCRGTAPSGTTMASLLRQTLPAFMIPKRYYLAAAIPRGTLGKVNRRQVQALVTKQQGYATLL